MGMVEELATHVDANSTRATIGTTLFANDLPHSTRATMAIMETPGGPPGQHFGDNDLPGWERPSVMFVARTTAPASGTTVPVPTNARRLLQDAFTIVQRIANENVGSTAVGTSYYLRIEPAQSPYLTRIEDDGRQVFAFNASVWRTPST